MSAVNFPDFPEYWKIYSGRGLIHGSTPCWITPMTSIEGDESTCGLLLV